MSRVDEPRQQDLEQTLILSLRLERVCLLFNPTIELGSYQALVLDHGVIKALHHLSLQDGFDTGALLAGLG